MTTLLSKERLEIHQKLFPKKERFNYWELILGIAIGSVYTITYLLNHKI